jgi:hypothetical protein
MLAMVLLNHPDVAPMVQYVWELWLLLPGLLLLLLLLGCCPA